MKNKMNILWGVSILLFLLWLLSNLEAGQHITRRCLYCGMFQEVRTTAGLVIKQSERSSRITPWYERRIGTKHLHSWLPSSCTGHLNVIQQGIAVSCRQADVFFFQGDEFAVVLERLEPLNLDKHFFKLYTTTTAELRSTVVATALARFPASASLDSAKEWLSKLEEGLTARE